MLIIDHDTVEAHLPSPAAAVESIKEALIAIADGSANTVPKIQVSAGEGRSYSNSMPAAWPDRNLFGTKWVTLTPTNPEKGLPFVQGSVLLSDPDDGSTLAILDAAPLTAFRTAAVTGASLAIDGGERRDVTFLGTGVQARSHARILEGLGYEEMTVWGRSSSSLDALMEWAAEHTPGISLKPTLDRDGAIRDAGVIITGLAMRVPGQEITSAQVRDDVTLLPLDYGTVVGKELAAASTLVADDPTQYEALRPAKIAEDYPKATGATGDLLNGDRPEGIVVAQNLGSGLGDIVIGNDVLASYRAANSN